MKIILVEDSKSFGSLLKQRFERKLSFEIIWARTKAEAEQVIEREGAAPFFLAVLDLNLPDALEGEIVDLFLPKQIPCVVLTGNFDLQLQKKMLSRGVLDYFLKDNIGVIDTVLFFIDRLQKNHAHPILVVDDSSSSRIKIRRLLERYRFPVLEAKGPGEALEILSSSPDIRLVVTDYNMPDMDGAELTKRIRSRSPRDELAVIGISSHDGGNLAAKFIKAGANDFLAKPYKEEELFCRITQNMGIIDSHLRLHQMVDQLRKEVESREAAERRTRHDYQARLAISRMLEKSLDPMPLPELLEGILEEIFGVPWLGMLPRGAIFLQPQGARELELAAYCGFSDAQLKQSAHMEPGWTLARRAMREARPLYTASEEILLESVRHRSDPEAHYCLPILVEKQPVGVIHLQLPSGYEIQEGEAEFLGAVGATVAGLIKRKGLEQQLKFQAEFDELTQLPNRVLFKDRLAQAIEFASRSKREVVVMFIDLDRFKQINDTMGHEAGDELLQEAARRIQICLRKYDTVARLGGDEFTVILPEMTHVCYVEFVARRILEEVGKPYRLKAGEGVVSGSIGVTVYPQDGDNLEDLLKNADSAMYQAKEAGRSTFRFYTPEMNARVVARLEMEKALRAAIDEDQLRLYYQPKVDLESGRMTGMEALVRWVQPDGAIISPGAFIPLAEESGLVIPMGRWVLKTACVQTMQWMNDGIAPLRVAVNISPRQFQESDDLVRLVAETLEDTGLPPEYLELEITESMVMEDVDRAIETMELLRAMGLYISVDDFGTGYSSLGSLKKFPIQFLKIDRSFIKDLSDDPNDAAIVSAIISMAHTLQLEVIAEGVESAEQLAFLKQLACNELQGYLFSPPVPAGQFPALLEKRLHAVAPE
ncbi:MAG: EAL domain-containing protein [Magnetococcales bacterium]|nr:EAL domain-containing protein [Magnetococcales bacterium]